MSLHVRTPRAALSVVPFLALLLTACPSEPSDPDAGHDAGRDAPASTFDASDAPSLDAPSLDAADDTASLDAGSDAADDDAGAIEDAGTDAPVATSDAGMDAGEPDVGVDASTRVNLLTSYCATTPTAPGLYRGTLASQLNDVAGACGHTAPGRDGSVRVELAPGQTLRASYRHAGDGILYLLDSCPVVGSCLASSDTSGEETLSFTNSGASVNPVYLILDGASLTGPQTFELDLFVDTP